MGAEATPRINSALLQKNVGRPVRLVGKVIGLNATHAFIEASDRGQVNVQLTAGSIIRQGVVEVLGRVNPDLSIAEMSSFMFQEDYDCDTYNRMVTLAHSQPELFGWA
ncbi:hypothetical protein HK105_201668 [Polyrhizophydium stewartii]|uniref:Replication factor A protein 3 n=1 Tax=Polyrhizophydium stewartii TaxID=2732419 RepID=A0ABR4NH24_9FUNG|nr:hypothetical protein HK105_006705 [Polyrhizophydium stewartii]